MLGKSVVALRVSDRQSSFRASDEVTVVLWV